MSTVKSVPFFDLNRLYLEQKREIDGAAIGALESAHYILGKRGSQFEAEFTAYLSPESRGGVIGCNSGTDALILSLLALEVGHGDEVIVPSHTAIPTITAIRSTGAIPKFCDIDPDTWVLNLAQATSLVNSRTKAIIAVHLYGNMVDIPALKKAACNIPIIEDVAQALGSTFDGAQAGTLGEFGAFSFYPTKNIGAFGDAGAVYACNETQVKELKVLRNYGQKDRYNAEVARGINSRLDEIQAAILSVRLRKLNEWNLRKKEMMDIYRKELRGLPVQLQRVTSGCKPAWHLAVIALENQITRDALMIHLEKQGVQTIIHYPHPTHLQKAFVSFNHSKLPITESLASRILSLPMNAGLRSDEQAYVIESLRAFFI